MKREDLNNLKRINPKQLLATKPDLSILSLKLLLYVDNMLYLINNYAVPICCTTGKHKADSHGRGLAIDYTLVNSISDEQWLIACAYCGLEGMGVYWNGKCKSYHNDVDHKPKQSWCGKKDYPGAKKPDGSPNDWIYGNFVLDVKEVII